MSIIKKFAIIHVLAFLFFIGCSAPYQDKLNAAFAGYNGEYCILVDKKNYILKVYTRDRKELVSYPAGYGLNPDGKTKLHSGDNRTPEGLYYINEILSMNAAANSPAYTKLKRMNEVYFRASGGHFKYGSTKEDLGDNAYGPRYYGIDYPNALDKKRYDENVKAGLIKPEGIGGGIAIHGNNDPAAIGHKSSSGCIRLYNNDVLELERYVLIGTPVVIVSD